MHKVQASLLTSTPPIGEPVARVRGFSAVTLIEPCNIKCSKAASNVSRFSLAKAKVAAGESKGKQKATELGLSGGEKNRVLDAYKFAALNKNTNYRVFDFGGGFSSADPSYFHKSLGGYHGAKLRNIQNLYDYHLSNSNNKVYDMMNVKYFIQQTEQGKITKRFSKI